MERDKEKFYQKLDFTQILFRHIDRINKSEGQIDFIKNVRLLHSMTAPFESQMSENLKSMSKRIEAAQIMRTKENVNSLISDFYVLLYQELMKLLYQKNLLGIQEEIEDIIDESDYE